MDVGMQLIFASTGFEYDDTETFQQELAMAQMAEELGFDVIWPVEHHLVADESYRGSEFDVHLSTLDLQARAVAKGSGMNTTKLTKLFGTMSIGGC